MAREHAIWTCPACAARAKGTEHEGLWPPHGWQTTDGGQLLAWCPAHRPEQPDVELPDPFSGFAGPI